jgi:hypothetical protein
MRGIDGNDMSPADVVGKCSLRLSDLRLSAEPARAKGAYDSFNLTFGHVRDVKWKSAPTLIALSSVCQRDLRRNRPHLSNADSARTPSFQVIFLPSS